MSTSIAGYAIVDVGSPMFGIDPRYRGAERGSFGAPVVTSPHYLEFDRWVNEIDLHGWLADRDRSRHYRDVFLDAGLAVELIAVSSADDLEPTWPLLGYDVWAEGVAPLAWPRPASDEAIAAAIRLESFAPMRADVDARFLSQLNDKLLFDSAVLARSCLAAFEEMEALVPGLLEGQHLQVVAIRLDPQDAGRSSSD